MMQAILCHQYGSTDVLKLTDIDKPEPKSNEVLIKVYASSVNSADWRMMSAKPPLVRLFGGLLKPRTPRTGSDVAGVVEVVGSDVTDFQVGDRVFGDLSNASRGAWAEYVATPTNFIAKLPKTISYQTAAAVPLAGITALQGLKRAGVKPGDKVMVHGASSGVGSLTVRIAQAMGATVTATARTSKIEHVQKMGADQVIDTDKEDLHTKGKVYDIVLDAAAFKPISSFAPVLKAGGKYVLVGGSTIGLMTSMLQKAFIKQRYKFEVINYLAKSNQADLQQLAGWMENEALKPYIQREFSLSEVPTAVQMLEDRQVAGKLVINVT